MRTLVLFVGLFACCFCSCQSPSGNTTSVFTVGSITNSPAVDSLDAGCFFGEAGSKSGLIFASGPDSIAYVSINDSVLGFKLIQQKDLSSDSAEAFIEIYKHGDYEVKIDIKQISQNDAGGEYSGTMSVKYKRGKSVVKKVEGTCGC